MVFTISPMGCWGGTPLGFLVARDGAWNPLPEKRRLINICNRPCVYKHVGVHWYLQTNAARGKQNYAFQVPAQGTHIHQFTASSILLYFPKVKKVTCLPSVGKVLYSDYSVNAGSVQNCCLPSFHKRLDKKLHPYLSNNPFLWYVCCVWLHHCLPC